MTQVEFAGVGPLNALGWTALRHTAPPMAPLDLVGVDGADVRLLGPLGGVITGEIGKLPRATGAYYPFLPWSMPRESYPKELAALPLAQIIGALAGKPVDAASLHDQLPSIVSFSFEEISIDSVHPE